MKVFVTHYTKLCERKADILEQFQTHNITDYEFIEQFDQGRLSDEEVAMFSTDIHPAMMSLTLKHFHAYRQIKDRYDHALIFEDDVILCENFSEIFAKYVADLPVDYDMLFIGDGCKLHIEPHMLVKDKCIYEKCTQPTHWGGLGGTRCLDSYLMSKKCAVKLCEYIDLNNHIRLSSDLWMNVAMRECNLKVYWAEPTIVTQGSESGKYKSESGPQFVPKF